MYTVIKNVIQSGNYELHSMLSKIDVIWIQGNITDEERTELIDMARDSADVSMSLDILKMIEELDTRVKKLESSAPTDPEVETYPEYVSGKWYYAGDKITFEGERYVCSAPSGTVCTWSPKDYPAYWTKES